MANQEFKLTLEGKKKLEEEYDRLINVDLPQVKREIAAAKEYGDLSENADYDAARERQRAVFQRMDELKNILNHCSIIEDVDSSTVQLGTTVQLKFLDENEVDTFRIVGTTEVDVYQNHISSLCPLAQAILNHKAGDVVTVKMDHPYDVEILSISVK